MYYYKNKILEVEKTHIHDKQHQNRIALLAACISLFIIPYTLYQTQKEREFIGLDDAIYVSENPYVQSGFNRHAVKWAFTAFRGGNWHPVTWLSHMADVSLFGLNPAGHHWMNQQIHVLNTILLFAVLMSLTGAMWPSYWVSLVFSVHPMHIESVAWISERKDLLCAFFYIAGIGMYSYWTKKHSIYTYAALLLCCLLGFMSKPMMVTFPFSLMLLDIWPLSRLIVPKKKFAQTFRKSFSEKIPLFILAAVFSFVAYAAQNHAGTVASLQVIPLGTRICNALVSYGRYVYKLFWPVHLSIYYPFIPPKFISIAASSAVIFLLSAVSVKNLTKRPYWFVGWFFFLGTLFPVIGIIQIGCQSHADRYTYLPYIGLILIISWEGYRYAFERAKVRWTIRTVAIGWVLWLLFCFSINYPFWKDTESLFNHSITVTPNNSIAYFVLGKTKESQGDIADAKRHYQKAIAINAGNYQAINNLGALIARSEDSESAIHYFMRAIRIRPGYTMAYCNIGKIYSNRKNYAMAIYYYENALQHETDMPMALYNLAWLYAACDDEKIRNSAKAIDLATRLCQIYQFKNPYALEVLGASYALSGRYKDAIHISENAYKIANNLKIQKLKNSISSRMDSYRKNLSPGE